MESINTLVKISGMICPTNHGRLEAAASTSPVRIVPNVLLIPKIKLAVSCISAETTKA